MLEICSRASSRMRLFPWNGLRSGNAVPTKRRPGFGDSFLEKTGRHVYFEIPSRQQVVRILAVGARLDGVLRASLQRVSMRRSPGAVRVTGSMAVSVWTTRATLLSDGRVWWPEDGPRVR